MSCGSSNRQLLAPHPSVFTPNLNQPPTSTVSPEPLTIHPSRFTRRLPPGELQQLLLTSHELLVQKDQVAPSRIFSPYLYPTSTLFCSPLASARSQLALPPHPTSAPTPPSTLVLVLYPNQMLLELCTELAQSAHAVMALRTKEEKHDLAKASERRPADERRHAEQSRRGEAEARVAALEDALQLNASQALIVRAQATTVRAQAATVRAQAAILCVL